MNKAEAIAGSIRKWECLCGSRMTVAVSLGYCSLCDFVGDDDTGCTICDACPLYHVQPCISDGSAWSEIREYIYAHVPHRWNEYLSDHPELCDLFERMLELVSSLEE
jgi:hypothetical protein